MSTDPMGLGHAPAEPEMWSPATVADILRVKHRTLTDMVNQGRFLPGTVVRETPAGNRFYRADLVEARFPALVAAWRERGRTQ